MDLTELNKDLGRESDVSSYREIQVEPIGSK